ncbi:YpzG family protein [Halobacillus sp. ACCC02827]|nr:MULTISPECIES: YpzG family protein [Bacillaceae]QHT45853.1 YpzG family protein [Bacillus sp. SB49]WJE16657.1 YpzG family protein [Halobacillus sp. ACCC02827]
MGNRMFNGKNSGIRSHRSLKHLNKRVNGETEQTQADQITEVQMRKRS